jgi:hypothetical protein
MSGADFDVEIEDAWRQFQRRLADRLAVMEEDDVLHVETETGVSEEELGGASPYLQFLCWDGGMLRAEAVGNVHLDERFTLTAEGEQRLLEIGWERPTYDEVGELVSGDANFHIDVELREADRVAVMTVRSLREVYGCAHPSFLWAEGLEEDSDQTFGGPETSVVDPGPEPVAVDPVDDEHLQGLVDDAMSVMLGDGMRHDDDGDIPVARGRSVVFVRLAEDRPAVDLYAEVVCDALDVDRLPLEVEVLNRTSEFGSFHVRGDQVVMRHRICALPFVPQHLQIVVATLCESLDEVARDVAQRVRGRRFLDEKPTRVEIEQHPAIVGLLEILHEDDEVSPAAVAALLDNDRQELIRLLVAIRTGRQSCDGHDEEQVLNHLRCALRFVAERAARPKRPLSPSGRGSQQLTLLAGDDAGELPLDLESRSS